MRTTRERVLAAYGGKCAWCSRTNIPLEIDHIRNDGKQHRATIKTNIDIWLCREYERTGEWSRLVQLLCKDCHAKKSGLVPVWLKKHQDARLAVLQLEADSFWRNWMPPKKGYTQLNVTLADELLLQVDALAQRENLTKSLLVEKLVRDCITMNFDITATQNFHDHLSRVSDEVLKRLERVEEIQTKVEYEVRSQSIRLERLEQQRERNHQEWLGVYDRRHRTTVREGWFSRLLSRLGFGLGVFVCLALL